MSSEGIPEFSCRERPLCLRFLCVIAQAGTACCSFDVLGKMFAKVVYKNSLRECIARSDSQKDRRVTEKRAYKHLSDNRSLKTCFSITKKRRFAQQCPESPAG